MRAPPAPSPLERPRPRSIPHGLCRCTETPRLRRDDAARRLVAAAAGHVPGALDLRGLRHLGGLPGRALPLRAVPLALLLARAVRRLAARALRAQASLVAVRDPLLGRAADPVGAGRLPLHLLLLPRRLLQVVLGRSAGLHGRRAAQALPGRAQPAADPAERASLLPVSRAAVHLRAGLGRLEGLLVRRRSQRRDALRR